MQKNPLGQLLVKSGVLGPPQLRQALEFQRGSGRRLATECLARQFASEAELLKCLSSQQGVPGVALGELALTLSVLDVVPEALAHKHRLLPIRLEGDVLFVAMADPQDSSALGEVSFLTNHRVVAWVALDGPLGQAIKDAYAAKQRGELEYHGAHFNWLDAGHALPPLICAHDSAPVPVDLMAGSASRPGRTGSGSEVIIELGEDDPHDMVIELDDDSVPAVRSGASSGPGQPSVLVVDDDQELRWLMARVLRGRGLDVRESGRGLEALSMIKERPPDLLVLDAMLPEVHGFDICRKLRSSTRYGSLPIVMISSYYTGWRFAKDLRDSYGVDEFVEKPFNLDKLAAIIERLLAQHRPQPAPPLPPDSSFLAAAMAAFRAGDLDQAIEHCREGLRIDPLSAGLHFRLGVFYLKKQGTIYQALQELEEAVLLDPELFVAQRSLAILYQRKGFKNKAIDMWERALHSSPSPEVRAKIREHLRRLL